MIVVIIILFFMKQSPKMLIVVAATVLIIGSTAVLNQVQAAPKSGDFFYPFEQFLIKIANIFHLQINGLPVTDNSFKTDNATFTWPKIDKKDNKGHTDNVMFVKNDPGKDKDKDKGGDKDGKTDNTANQNKNTDNTGCKGKLPVKPVVNTDNTARDLQRKLSDIKLAWQHDHGKFVDNKGKH